jgi:branched-chain amino acid transport system permease protein
MPDLIGALSYASFFLVFATAYAIITLGLNLQWGYTGLFNVGVAGFVAIGAYTTALLTTPAASDRLAGMGLPVAVGMLAAMAVTGLVGLLVGALALRLRQDYLAITTFGIAVTIQLVANNATPLTGPLWGAVHPQADAGLAGYRPTLDTGLPGSVAVAVVAGLPGHRATGQQPLGARAARHP